MSETSHPDESLPYLRALGDPERLKIVQLLRDGPKSVSDICRAMGSPIANVSHHLHSLKETGIVSAAKRGRFVIYKLDHVSESRDGGRHVLDFGCCRIEFGEGRETPSISGPRPEHQALEFLNRLLQHTPAGGDETTSASRSSKTSETNQIAVANASFESPSTPFFNITVDGWEKEGNPSSTGVFRNFPDDAPIPGSKCIVNADGNQLATIAARAGSGLFQMLKASYQQGKRYTLNVGVGVSSVQPPANNNDILPRLRVSFIYTDKTDVRHEVASCSVTPSDLDPAPGRLTYISVSSAIDSESPAAGRAIGILISTPENSANHDGHFILDNISLIVDNAGEDDEPDR